MPSPHFYANLQVLAFCLAEAEDLDAVSHPHCEGELVRRRPVLHLDPHLGSVRQTHYVVAPRVRQVPDRCAEHKSLVIVHIYYYTCTFFLVILHKYFFYSYISVNVSFTNVVYSPLC